MNRFLLAITLFVCSLSVNGQSIAQLQLLASQGNADAQYILACRYAQGSGVEQNFAQAFHWLTQASGQEHPDATNYLGLCYCNGIGTERNLEKAFSLFYDAAAHNSSEGQYNLAYCYYYGEGTALNYEQAFYWFSKAAQQGHTEATNKLGECYKNGQGVKQNYGQALQCFQRAAAEQNIGGMYNIALLYFDGEGVEQNHALAFEWFTKAAARTNTSAGHPWAQYYLGLCYQNGLGTTPSDTQAAQQFAYAATQHYNQAQQALGRCYEEGRGVAQNYATAYKWFHLSNAPELTTHYDNVQQFEAIFLPRRLQQLHPQGAEESNSSYAERIQSLMADSARIAPLRNEAAELYLSIKQEYFSYSPLEILNYNALQGTFALASSECSNQLLDIAPQEAEAFMNLFPTLKQTPHFALIDGRIAIHHFTLYTAEHDKTYTTYPNEKVLPSAEENTLNAE